MDVNDQAREHVIRHARRSTAVKCDRPYMVRWPLHAPRLIRANDTDELVRKVAKEMRQHRPTVGQ